MELTFSNKSTFCNNFLVPISKISDKAILTISEDGSSLLSLNNTVDSSLILCARFGGITVKDVDRVNINIGDVNKLIKALDTIQDEQVTLKINSNNIEYKSTRTKFKFHLLEDGIIVPSRWKTSKIDAFKYDMSFVTTPGTINAIMKNGSFLTSEKMYIYTEDGKVMCEMTDKSKANVDSFTTLLSGAFTGNSLTSPAIYRTESIQLISSLKSNVVDININTELQVMCVDITDDTSNLKYIVTSRVV